MVNETIHLTHDSSVLLIYTPWKPKGRLIISGGIDKQHRAVIGSLQLMIELLMK